MSDVRYNEIKTEEEGQRLDNYLLRILKGVPKSHIYRIIRQGEVRINKKRAKPTTRLISGDIIRIPPLRMSMPKTITVHKPLEERLLEAIIFEDAQLLILNKPAGIAVHGGSGLSLGVIEALRVIRSDLHYLELAHRLDKETSGCLVLAKKRSALREINALFEARAVTKTYWAILKNRWQGKKTQIVDAALLKNSLKSGERIVRVQQEGKASTTVFKLIENFDAACLVEAVPETGRTHQIRVHAASLDHPIIGDEKYGLDTKSGGKLYLHAQKIAFTLANKAHRYEAPLDKRFTTFLDELRKGRLAGNKGVHD